MSLFFYSVLLVALGLLIAGLCKYYFPFRRPLCRSYPRVLLYHACDQIVFPGMPKRLNMNPHRLEQQLVWLKRQGYLFLTASELIVRSEEDDTLCACITFDDGFEDNYTYLFPLLKKHQIKITLFVSQRSVFLGKPMLREAQIKEMSASGLVEFGGHTVTHIDLNATASDVAEAEIQANKKWLESVTGQPCRAFAYPFGKYTERDILILKRLGFTSAFTCERAIRPLCDPFQIPRLYVNGKVKSFQFPLLVSRGKFRL
jgi:peptidoglycan/xylan/chitin deacetylase (PgdA/CDA1 family)